MSHTEMLQKAYTLFVSGDIPGLLDEHIDESCKWIQSGPKDKIPFAGTYNGKNEISHCFQSMAGVFEYSLFEPRQFIEQGDAVAVLGSHAYTATKTGKKAAGDWLHVIRLNEAGKAVSFQSFFDSAAAVEALTP
jgi:uncharacterized protein